MYMHICMYVIIAYTEAANTYILSLSLSLSIYIYIYIYAHIHK